MRMVSQYFQWLIEITGIPEPGFTIISTAGQIVLLVGVEIKIPYHLAMSGFQAVYLSKDEIHVDIPVVG